MIIEIGSDGNMTVKSNKPLTEIEEDIIKNVSEEIKK